MQIISFLHSPVQLPAPDRQRTEYKRGGHKRCCTAWPKPISANKKAEFFSFACMELLYCDRVVIFYFSGHKASKLDNSCLYPNNYQVMWCSDNKIHVLMPYERINRENKYTTDVCAFPPFSTWLRLFIYLTTFLWKCELYAHLDNPQWKKYKFGISQKQLI